MKFNKVIYLSIVTALSLQATEVALDTVTVEESIDTVTVKDVSGEELKSADLGEALSKIDPAITISRRSGIANDIILRGQKRDNINVTIDGGKIYGGCPNRMDPPISHVLTNNIDFVTINEGPYDVENFGTLSGLVQVHTKAPKSGFSGEANLNVGSFGYQKGSLTMQGGNNKVKALITVSKETSEQYKDGNGDKFNEQLKKAGTASKYLYQPKYENMDAYTKKSFMGKLYFNIMDNQELKLSYTANRSDDVLYPSSPMDALYDDSDLYNIEYTIKNLGNYSKQLNFLYYYSDVDHPMSNIYRNSTVNITKELTNHMKSKIEGAKVKNEFLYNNTLIKYGIDTSKRTWEGKYIKNGVYQKKSLPNAITKNKAFFIDLKQNIDSHKVKFGLRYDDTDVTNDDSLENRTFSATNGYIFDTYSLNSSTDIFAGFGIAHRVPDGRELYFIDKSSSKVIGTPNLNQTKNSEFDIGIKKTYENSSFKIKVFYSQLDDYIYFDSNLTKNNFVNIDAKIYGAELSGAYLATESLNFEYGISYQKGTRDQLANPNKSGTNLADIVPIRANLVTNYDFDNKSTLSFEIIAQGEWKDYDKENGEQRLPGFATANLKIKKELTNKLNITLGVDNIFDKAYTPSNTYNDLTLVMAGGTQKVKLNDPGRYAYLNVSYKF